MIEVKAKSAGKNKYKITVNINGSNEIIIAEVMAIHKQLLKTPRGTKILTDAMDQMQEYINEVNKEHENSWRWTYKRW